jgi:hypothetical protein
MKKGGKIIDLGSQSNRNNSGMRGSGRGFVWGKNEKKRMPGGAGEEVAGRMERVAGTG